MSDLTDIERYALLHSALQGDHPEQPPQAPAREEAPNVESIANAILNAPDVQVVYEIVQPPHPAYWLAAHLAKWLTTQPEGSRRAQSQGIETIAPSEAEAATGVTLTSPSHGTESPATRRPPEPFGDPTGPEYQRGEIHQVDPDELYVEMACCGFRYSADHEDSTTEGYTCPLCVPAQPPARPTEPSEEQLEAIREAAANATGGLPSRRLVLTILRARTAQFGAPPPPPETP